MFKRFKARGKKRFKARRPYLRKARSGLRRKNPLKVFYGRKASQVIIKQPSGVPDRLYVKLRYREQLNFAQLAGALSTNVYRGNSLFDPDFTGTGGQPYFFDQWSALYSTYTVLASSIQVRSMLNGAGVFNTITTIVPQPFSGSFGSASQELMEEQPYAKVNVMKATTEGGWGFQKHYMSTSKILGVKRYAIEAEDNYSALISASPTDTWTWHIGNYVPGGSNQSLIQDVIITYYAVFEQRARPAIS